MDVPHLYRYVPKGTYYLRGRFGGAPVRICLHTDDYALAVEKLEDQRRQLRLKQKAAGSAMADCLHAALVDVGALIVADPTLRAPTKDCYRWTLERMKPGKPFAPPRGPLNLIGSKEMADWWARVAAEYAPQQANYMLMLVRRAVKRIRKALPFVPDPTADLKRVRVLRTRLELLTREQFARVVAYIRGARKVRGDRAADYVEFMAYSGCRPKEIEHIEWRDIRETVMEIWGGPDRPKNGEMRLVPIIPAMRPLLDRMRGDAPRAGRLFTINKPREALKTACKRVGVRRQRIYDLRHLFATTCLESGVDVPTFANWMGHKDGGALALRTYVQNRDEHRDRMAAKVNFG